MTPALRIKICGLRRAVDLKAASEAGADAGGMVFFKRSPRHLTLMEATELRQVWPAGLSVVALTVDASDAELDGIVDVARPDWLQLHGSESPERVDEVKHRFGLPVMKAVGIANTADLARAATFSGAADMLLLDAKAPPNAALPGGNGLAFDWQLVLDGELNMPWMLAGGLGPSTVTEAIRISGARGVDVSSGVENAPGLKDPALIRAFVQAAREALDL